MKKIKDLIKKIGTAIAVSFLAMPKVFGVQYLYGPAIIQPVKKEPEVVSIPKAILAVPFIFIWGLALYLYNSKSSKERKILITVFTLLIVTVVCIGCYNYYTDPEYRRVVLKILKQF